MPGTTPIKGLPYPTETDPIYQGAAKVKELALAVEAALVSAGQAPPTGVPLVAASAIRTTMQSIPNAALTLMTWQTGQWDARPSGAAAQYSSAGLTARVKGLYAVQMTWPWAYTASSAGDRVVYLYKNQTEAANVEDIDGRRARNVGDNVNRISTQIYLSPGDLLRIGVYQDSGAALGGGGPVIGNVRGRLSWTYLGNPL